MEWIIALLGISFDFLSRYKAKTKKEPWEFSYWIKDNWLETVQSIILVTVLLIAFTHADFSINPEEFHKWLGNFISLPDGVLFPISVLVPFIIGYGANALVYRANKRKEKWIIEKNKI